MPAGAPALFFVRAAMPSPRKARPWKGTSLVCREGTGRCTAAFPAELLHTGDEVPSWRDVLLVISLGPCWATLLPGSLLPSLRPVSLSAASGGTGDADGEYQQTAVPLPPGLGDRPVGSAVP